MVKPRCHICSIEVAEEDFDPEGSVEKYQRGLGINCFLVCKFCKTTFLDAESYFEGINELPKWRRKNILETLRRLQIIKPEAFGKVLKKFKLR